MPHVLYIPQETRIVLGALQLPANVRLKPMPENSVKLFLRYYALPAVSLCKNDQEINLTIPVQVFLPDQNHPASEPYLFH